MVYIYCRVSTKKQEDNYSFESQKRNGIAFAEELGQSYELYKDVESGKKATRSDWVRLLSDLKSKGTEHDIIWYGSQSRLMRDAEEFQSFKKLCIKKRIKVYESRQSKYLDFAASKGDRIAAGVQSIIDEEEVIEIEKRTINELRVSWDLGFRVHTKIYGYDSSMFNPETGKKVWTKVPDEEKIIKLAVEMYLNGEGVRHIARVLNDKGYRWRGGKPFTHYEVNLMISKPIYAGLTKDSNGKERKSELYDPIITIEQWRKLEVMLPLRKKKGRDGRAIKHTGSSILRCASCGMPYESAPDTRGHFYYRHRGPKPKECEGRQMVTERGAEYLIIDAYVWGILNMTDKTLADIKEKLLGSESEQDLDRFDSLIKTTERKIDNWMEAVGESDDKALHTLYNKRINDAMKELEQLKSQKAKIVHANEESLEKYHQAVQAFSSNNLREFFKVKDGRSRNAMLRSVIKAVHVPKGNVFQVEYQDGRKRTMIYRPMVDVTKLDAVNVIAMEDWDDQRWKLFLRGKTLGNAASLLGNKIGKDARYPKAKKNTKTATEAKEIMKAFEVKNDILLSD